MTLINVTLAKRNFTDSKENCINPFWFTTDHSIHLNSKDCHSVSVILEKLSERSILELEAAYKLGLVIIDKPNVFKLPSISDAA